MKALCTLLAALVLPLAAHHAWPVNEQKVITVTGKVTAIDWANPHPMFSIDVTTDKGIEKWQVGGPALNRMEANGWSKTTVKVGDIITGVGHQFTDGQKIVKLETLTLPGGKQMKVYAR